MTDNILIAIPARGGSKRLPRKNLVLLGGKPMIAYTIEAAVAAELTPHIYVCTEDDEIACIAIEYGIRVFRIPLAMADDEVSSTVPCLALYDQLMTDGMNLDYIFNLQPTSPLRNVNDIRDSFRTLISEQADFLVSVTPVDPHYFHWVVVEANDGWKMYFGKEYLRERAQLPEVFRPNGAIKLARAAKLKVTGNYFGDSLVVYRMPEERSIHVATQYDIDCASAMLNLKRGANEAGRK